MTDYRPWKTHSAGITFTGTGSQVQVPDPVTRYDAANVAKRRRYWYVPFRRRIWPVAYELLTHAEILEKRARWAQHEMHAAMARNMFGGADD